MFSTSRHRRRSPTTLGVLPARPQRQDASYDAATLAFMHVYERISTMPESVQPAAWQKVTRTLASLPNPDLAESLALD